VARERAVVADDAHGAGNGPTVDVDEGGAVADEEGGNADVAAAPDAVAVAADGDAVGAEEEDELRALGAVGQLERVDGLAGAQGGERDLPAGEDGQTTEE